MTETQELTPAQQDSLDRLRTGLLSGAAFSWAASSNRSVIGYQPPITSRDYGHVLQVAGEMAKAGDLFAAVAREIVHRVNLYGTRSQVLAAANEAVAQFVRHGYDDVIGRTGPEAGRPSSHHHAVTLGQAIALRYYLAEIEAPMGSSIPGVGWGVETLAKEAGVRRPFGLRHLEAFEKKMAQEAEKRAEADARREASLAAWREKEAAKA